MNSTKKSISVFAPASVSNLGCGFDTIGFALEGVGEVMTLTKREDDQLVIAEIIGADLSKNPLENIATLSIQAFLDAMRLKLGFDITINKHFKPGSGLGSSASSAVAAVFAANQFLETPLPAKDLLPYALHGESYASGGSIHADNVAPSLLGGIQFTRSYEPVELFSISPPKELNVLIVYPDVEVKTASSRSLVPKEISVKTARNQWANVGALIHAIHTENYNLLKKAITDEIAEPVRKHQIPAYDEMKEIAFLNNSVGFNISGSGPSMFSFFTDLDDMDKMKNQAKEIYDRMGLNCLFYESKIDPIGCRCQ